jgi:hypothetical protein
MKLSIKTVVVCTIEAEISAEAFLRWMRINRPMKIIDMNKAKDNKDGQAIDDDIKAYLQDAMKHHSLLIEDKCLKQGNNTTINPSSEDSYFVDARVYYPPN